MDAKNRYAKRVSISSCPKKTYKPRPKKIDTHVAPTLSSRVRTQNPRYENCSHFQEKIDFWGVEIRFLESKNVEKYLYTMFPYTEKYTESESDIQNNDLLYKIDQQIQNTFAILERKCIFSRKKTRFSNLCFVIYINCIVRILYLFVFFFVFFIFVHFLRQSARRHIVNDYAAKHDSSRYRQTNAVAITDKCKAS